MKKRRKGVEMTGVAVLEVEEDLEAFVVIEACATIATIATIVTIVTIVMKEDRV